MTCSRFQVKVNPKLFPGIHSGEEWGEGINNHLKVWAEYESPLWYVCIRLREGFLGCAPKVIHHNSAEVVSPLDLNGMVGWDYLGPGGISVDVKLRTMPLHHTPGSGQSPQGSVTTGDDNVWLNKFNLPEQAFVTVDYLTSDVLSFPENVVKRDVFFLLRDPGRDGGTWGVGIAEVGGIAFASHYTNFMEHTIEILSSHPEERFSFVFFSFREAFPNEHDAAARLSCSHTTHFRTPFPCIHTNNLRRIKLLAKLMKVNQIPISIDVLRLLDTP